LNRKNWEYRAVIIEGVIIFIVFAIIFIVISIVFPQNLARRVVVAGFFITEALFLIYTIRYRYTLKNAIHRITQEMEKLPDNFNEKSYDYIHDETRIFYEALSRVQKRLDKKWRMRQELLDIANTVAGNMDFTLLLHDLLPKLNEVTRSICSAFYAVNPTHQKLEIKHSVGFNKSIYSEFDIVLGEGMIGQASVKKEITVYRDIPDDTVYLMRTFLGKIKPRCVIVVPVTGHEQAGGVLVCASIYEYTHDDCDMFELIRHYLGVGVNNGINFDRTKRLTNELTFQNKLIQDQHLDMKKRLDEKTQLLNHIVNNIEESCLYALDTRGVVLLWNKGAERVHGIAATYAIGRNIDRLFEENNWPSITRAVQQAQSAVSGSHSECFWRVNNAGNRLQYEMTVTSLYNERRESIGVLNSVREL
jgi:PAS domain S-box-containing protein